MPNYYYPENWSRPRGRVHRIEANIAAIKLLKRLETEARDATQEEQAILANYNGWGGDKEVFNDATYGYWKMGQQFSAYRNAATDGWYKEYGRWYEQLKELLTEDEWKAAAASTLNAHYTETSLAVKMWETAERLGFDGGVVLEPAIGTGVFISTMPPHLRDKTHVIGVELDSLSARISKQLFPEAEIHAMGFQNAPIRNNSVDMVLTNVPFSDTGPGEQMGPVKFNLHNYFIEHGLDKLRQGGVSLTITSASTMENNSEQRRAIAERSEMVGAIRLPKTAFEGNANTEVVTDVLVLRKPDSMALGGNDWTAKVPVALEPEKVFLRPHGGNPIDSVNINEYYAAHPEMVLGKHSLAGSMYGRSDEGQYTVEYDGALPLAEAMSGAIQRLPQGALSYLSASMERENSVETTFGVKPGGFTLNDAGELRVAMHGRDLSTNGEVDLKLPPWERLSDYKLPRGFTAEKATTLAIDYVQLRESLKTQIRLDLSPDTTDEQSAEQRAKLNQLYDAWVAKWGSFNGKQRAQIATILEDDPEFGAVLALENVRETQGVTEITKAAILSERTLFPERRVEKAESVADAMYLSLDRTGRIDTAYMAGLLGSTPEEVREGLIASEIAFEDPGSGEMIQKERYLSGSVVDKLDVARRAVVTDPRFQRNVDALQAVAPEIIPFENIRAPLGASWLPPSVLQDFAREKLGQRYNCEFHYVREISEWRVDIRNSTELVGFGTSKMAGSDIFLCALSGKQPRVVWYDEGRKPHFDQEGTSSAIERYDAIRKAWSDWLKSNEKAREEVTRTYNTQFNRCRPSSYDGSHLTFPGLSRGPGALAPRKHQRDAVARILSEGCGLLAHNVGFGKTLEMILLARELKRTGMANKPMIVCDNPSYSQFVSEIRRCYPQLNILCSNRKHAGSIGRNAFLSQVATGSWDLIVVPQSHFDLIPNSPKTELKFEAKEMSDLESAITSARANLHGDGARKCVRRIQKKLEKAQARYTEMRLELQHHQDKCLYWEDLGVDFLIVDEAHKYKRVPFATSFDRIKGIDTSRSQRALRMLMKAASIQEKRNGKGVVLATATPVSNTMAEAWNMIRLCDPQRLKEYNVPTFDEFVTTFCETVNALELNESSGKWKYETRLSKFINGPTFIDFIRASWDVQMDTSVLKLPVPALEGGQIKVDVVPMTAEVGDLMDGVSAIYDSYEKANPADKKEMSYVPLVLMSVSLAASIDPRLVDPKAPDSPASLINRVVNNAVTVYNQTRADKGTQVIFADRYRTMKTGAVEQLLDGGLKVLKENVAVDLDGALVPEGKSKAGDDEDADGVDLDAEVSEGDVPQFNLYEDLRAKFIQRGIPADKIAVITDAKTDAERTALFNRVNEGDVAIIIGSTAKLGTGVNIQRRLAYAHHVDPPRSMTPADLTQRNGRIVRQGNLNKSVGVVYYGMQDTAAPGIFDRISRKDKFIQQALAGKGVGVEFEDCGEVRLEEMKAALISDKRQLHRAELLGAIKEEQTKIEVANERRHHMERELWHYELITNEKTKELADTEAFLGTFCKDLRPVLSDSDEVCVVWPDGKATHGPMKDVEKEIQKKLDEWRKDPPHTIGKEDDFGQLIVNGMRMIVRKDTRVWKEGNKQLSAVVPGGMPPSMRCFDKDARHEITAARYDFASAKSMISAVAHTVMSANNAAKGFQKSIEEAQSSSRKIQAEIDGLSGVSVEKLDTLRKELLALEEDMAKNPAERRRPIRGGHLETSMVMAISAEVRQKLCELEEFFANISLPKHPVAAEKVSAPSRIGLVASRDDDSVKIAENHAKLIKEGVVASSGVRLSICRF